MPLCCVEAPQSLSHLRRGCPLQNEIVSQEWFWASNANLMSMHLPADRETIVEEDLTHHCARPSNEQEQGYWDSLKPHETSSATSQVSSSVTICGCWICALPCGGLIFA